MPAKTENFMNDKPVSDIKRAVSENGIFEAVAISPAGGEATAGGNLDGTKGTPPSNTVTTVSYTHLTLPTIYSV